MSKQDPLRMLERRFVVNTTRERAWEHLERVEAWPSWARHIKRVELKPSGALTPESEGAVVLTNGIRSTFRMQRLEPGRSWLWSGPFLWMTVHYDHRFEDVGEGRTEIVFVLDGEGFSVSVLGRMFAKIYAFNLDRAIPRLIEELESA